LHLQGEKELKKLDEKTILLKINETFKEIEK
jgi:hypothetical protein